MSSGCSGRPTSWGTEPDRTITVQLQKPDMKEGAHALFFARGWLYGESIAVTEVGRTSANEPEELRKQLEQSEQRAEERALLDRIAKASLIVIAKVGRMAPPAKGPAGR